MGEDLGNKHFSMSEQLQGDNIKLERHETVNQCRQCNFVASQAGDFIKHLKTHSGGKLNKCNQCDYASFYAQNLKTHLKTHSGKVKQMQPM